MQSPHALFPRRLFERLDELAPESIPATIGKDNNASKQSVSPAPLNAAIADRTVQIEAMKVPVRLAEITARQARLIQQRRKISQFVGTQRR